MNFIEWLFVQHWLFSTIFMPGLSFLYAMFTDSVAWAWGCAIWFVGFHVLPGLAKR